MKSFFTIADNSQLLKMPYGASEGSGTKNIGYIDLKEQPEQIDKLHELEGFPEFKELILLLNQPESIFVTLRIDTATDFYNVSST